MKLKREKEKESKLKETEFAEFASERRRLNRVNEKKAQTTCFACREQGHAARDCPNAQAATGDEAAQTEAIVGICYRCGSIKHTLSRCKKVADKDDPFPFASCFVCSGKGHLASSCPQNKARGVYPNGGCCKLCGDTSHLARNCDLHAKEVVNPTTIIGSGHEAGADEDDFHLFKRHNTEVEREEKREEKAKRQLEVKSGVHSGIVKTFGKVSAGKVVKF